MNANESLVEINTPFVGFNRATVAGGVSTIPILGTRCQQVGFLVKIDVGAGVTAGDQVRIRLFAQNANNSASQQLEIDGIFKKTGAPLLNTAGVSGMMFYEQLGAFSGQIWVPATEYLTPAADGTKEIMVYLRARSRELNVKDMTYLRADLFATNARLCSVMMFTEHNDAGPLVAPRSYHVA